jgi:hypothetical protein
MASRSEAHEMKDQLLVYASSLSAIDFTAIALASLHSSTRNANLLAMIKKEARISPSRRNRRFESRFALPLAHFGNAPDGTVRQLFLPIDCVTTATLRQAIEESGESYADIVSLEGGKRLRRVVLERTSVLAERACSLHGTDASAVAGSSLAILSGIYELLGLRRIDVRLYEDEFPSNMRLPDLGSSLSVLASEIHNSGPLEGAFAKGGAIEIRHREGPKAVAQLRDFKIDGEYLSIHGDGCKIVWDGRGVHFEFPTSLAHASEEDLTWTAKGPLDVIRVLSCGKLAHIPWYYDVIEEGQCAVEFISPITTVSECRSGFCKSNPFRLSPSGFTLSDYDSNITRAYLDGILSKPWWSKRYPGRFLSRERVLSEYPTQREMGSKSRAGLKKYIDRIRQDVIERQPENTRRSLKAIFETGGERGELYFDEDFVRFFDVFSYLSSCCSTQSNVFLDAEVRSILDSMGLLTENGFVCAAIVEKFADLLGNFCSWAAANGASLQYVVSISPEVSRILSQLWSIGIISFASEKSGEKTKGIVSALQRLSSFALMLAAVAWDHLVLLANSVLNANVLAVFLLEGPEGFRQSADKIFQARGEKDLLTGSPKLI